MTQDPSLRPLPPVAKRLNRNALTVAAVIMGMTVLTAVVVLNPGRSDQARSADAVGVGALAQPSQPTFLDDPARGLDSIRESTTVGAPAVPRDSSGQSLVWGRTDAPRAGFDGGVGSGPSSRREQAFEAALRSPVLAGGSGAPRPTNRTSSPAAQDEQRLLALGDSLTRAFQQPSHAGQNQTSHQRDFLERAGDAGGASVIAQIEPAGSPWTLRAGTVVPGVLLTAINSDLPGEIVGQVSRNVYDSRSQRLLLIPKGAKLVGTYDNRVAAGQDRLLVAWTRLILPDGRSMILPGLALKDRAGQTGASDQVDNHYSRVFGHAVLLSAISAGAQLSQPRQGSILAAPSAGQVAAGALGQELSDVALEILRRGMDVAPTIIIRQGQPFLVFLHGDLVFGGPYQPEP